MVSLFGNSLVCQVFIKHKEINKSTGLLIFNLAISDILIILLNSPFALVSQYIRLVPAHKKEAVPIQDG
jgi:G protein-coupled receptor 83